MGNAIETRPTTTIIVYLSTDSYYGDGYEEIGVTKSDLDRLDEKLTYLHLVKAYPDADVQVWREGMGGSVAIHIPGAEHMAELDMREEVEGVLETAPSIADEYRTEEALKAAVAAL